MVVAKNKMDGFRFLSIISYIRKITKKAKYLYKARKYPKTFFSDVSENINKKKVLMIMTTSRINKNIL